jgi:hypothetical protein
MLKLSDANASAHVNERDTPLARELRHFGMYAPSGEYVQAKAFQSIRRVRADLAPATCRKPCALSQGHVHRALERSDAAAVRGLAHKGGSYVGKMGARSTITNALRDKQLDIENEDRAKSTSGRNDETSIITQTSLRLCKVAIYDSVNMWESLTVDMPSVHRS